MLVYGDFEIHFLNFAVFLPHVRRPVLCGGGNGPITVEPRDNNDVVRQNLRDDVFNFSMALTPPHRVTTRRA